jgi:hypothetical protein
MQDRLQTSPAGKAEQDHDTTKRSCRYGTMSSDLPLLFHYFPARYSARSRDGTTPTIRCQMRLRVVFVWSHVILYQLEPHGVTLDLNREGPGLRVAPRLSPPA